MARTLTSVPTLVESPFVIVKIGDYTFGQVKKTKSGNKLEVTFPEYMKSVEVTKVNGEVNTYTIVLEYPITKGNDPNLIDYVFSSVSATRKLTISYGDWNSPSFIYKEEETLITKVGSRLDFNNPKITYTINCVSDAKGLQSVNHNFPSWNAQPSEIIMNMLRSPVYKLTDIFTGMINLENVKKYALIEGGDKVVHIPAKLNCDVWNYLNYLVGFMIPDGTPSNSITSNGFYRLSVVDDNKNELGGPYFTITKVSTTNNMTVNDEVTNSIIDLGTYELDVGYPNDNFVTDFQLDNNQEWSILYSASNTVDLKNYSYKIDNNGQMKRDYSPTLTRLSSWDGTTAADKSWWTSVTGFPLRVVLTLKGLVRPTILMSSIKLNVVFYGQKHIASGYYVIEKEVDRVDDGGYKTTLSLLRVKGDTINENEVTVRNNVTDPSTGFNLARNSGQSIDYRGDELFNSLNYGYGNGKVKTNINPTILSPSKNKTSQNGSSYKHGIQTEDMSNNAINKKIGI